MGFENSIDAIIRASSVDSMICDAKQEVSWLVEGLIEDDREKGHQWLITGEPKMGKSRLAMQLAVSLAEGTDFLGFNIPRRRKVLYFNFELSKRVAACRTLDFFDGDERRLLACTEHFNVISSFARIDVLNAESFQHVRKVIAALDPDVIFWDVLRRMNSAEENNNVEMSHVMQAIRMVSSGRTHIVVHHSKKEQYDRNAGARGIRGASSIHAEADGVIAIAKIRERHTLEFSARSIADLDTITLNSEGLRFVRANVESQPQTRKVEEVTLSGLVSNNIWAPRKELRYQIMTKFRVSGPTADRYLESWTRSGEVERKKDGRETYYKWLGGKQSSSS